MTDLPKFDLQKIIGDVKAMIGPVVIPEANKDDPVGYCLSELSKLAKDLAESHSKQADTIAKISTMLGTLHLEITNARKALGSPVTQPAGETKPTSEAKPAGETKETK